MDLDQAVVDFLQEDGLVLPEESHAVSGLLHGSFAHDLKSLV
jgi:hypothetical protein